MKKLIVLTMTVLLLLTMICGCGKKPIEPTGDAAGENAQEVTPEVKAPSDAEIKSSIVGAWVGEDDGQRLGYIFNEDGTGVAALFPMTYTVEDGIITVTVEAFGEKKTASARYSIDGDTLVIETDDGEYVLERTEMPEA